MVNLGAKKDIFTTKDNDSFSFTLIEKTVFPVLVQSNKCVAETFPDLVKEHCWWQRGGSSLF